MCMDCKLIRPDKNHNPRKGTETSWNFFSSLHDSIDKNHNPRKGTETCVVLNSSHYAVSCDKNHNPRKGTETHTPWDGRTLTTEYEIRTIIPARGRKHLVTVLESINAYDGIRTIIPARGRKLVQYGLYDGIDYDKNHNPRKGTETVMINLASMMVTSDKNHNPRKGTET